MVQFFCPIWEWSISFEAIEYLTFLLVLITAMYAFFTFKILNANQNSVLAMQEQIEASTRPYVSIRISMQVEEPFFYLNIENIGKTAAKNLKLSIDKDFYQYGEKSEEKNIKNFPIFNELINEFTASTHLFYPLINSAVILNDEADTKLVPRKFKIMAEYSYSTKKNVVEEFNFDLSVYQNCIALKDPLVTAINVVSKNIAERKAP